MQCLILAGGLGTRMKVVSETLPKALLPVGPRTFIDWQLTWLKACGVDRALLLLADKSELIEAHIQKHADEGRYPEIDYAFDGPELLGTGGAIRNAANHIADHFIVTYGDSFLRLNIRRMFAEHKRSGASVTLSIEKNKNARDLSNVVYRGGQIEVYDKKNRVPEMEYIDYGMSVVTKKDFLAVAPRTGKYDFSDFLTAEVVARRAQAFVADKPFFEIGSPSGYELFCKAMASCEYDLERLSEFVS